MEEEKIDLYECGDWEVFARGAGYGDARAIVYNTPLKIALKVGCELIEQKYSNPYDQPTAHRWDDGHIRYDNSDPWYVDVKKVS